MSTAGRRGVLRLGDRVCFDGVQHTVVGLSGSSVRLAGDDGVDQVVLAGHLQAAPDFAVISGAGPVSLPLLGLLDAAPAEAVEQARWWEAHVLEVETGRPPHAEPGTPPRPGYDPARHTLAEREQVKVAELTALGHAVSRATIRRRRAAYAASGLWGLIDQRSVSRVSPTGRVDERVVAATRRALAEQVTTSTGTPGPAAPAGRAAAGRDPRHRCGGDADGLDVLPVAGQTGHRRAFVRGGHHPPVAGPASGRPVRHGGRAAAWPAGADRHDTARCHGSAR
ncbi:MAG TPA: hypothetical protein VFU36_03480 [Jatrophihabitans sp.]|nr:hypothetical protein [Jatrophihabitans sp.]